MRTYLWGYQGQRRSRATIDSYWQVAALDPEMRRRVWAELDTAQDEGHDLGIGGGTRTFKQQQALWIKRNGVGVARAGFSYHEDDSTPRGAAAVDLVGDLAWNVANSHRFHLVNFSHVNDEDWHNQLDDIPHSRSEYKQNPSAFPIVVKSLPGSGTTPDPPVPVPPTPVHPPPVITPVHPYYEGAAMYRIAGKEILPNGTEQMRIGDGDKSVLVSALHGGQTAHTAANAAFGGMIDAKSLKPVPGGWKDVQVLDRATLDARCGKVR